MTLTPVTCRWCSWRDEVYGDERASRLRETHEWEAHGKVEEDLDVQRFSSNKDLNRYINGLRKQGWKAEHGGDGHIVLTHKSGVQIRAAATPGDSNAVHVIRRLVRNRMAGRPDARSLQRIGA